MTASPPSPDLDLRLVRHFIVVAEHGHFGRAAAVLRFPQSSLSRQIKRLEQDVGARLIDRGPQGCSLTEAGEIFLPYARNLLRAAAETVVCTRAAAQPNRITVGYTANLVVTPAVLELRSRYPEATVQTIHLGVQGVREALLEHRADVAVTRLPLATDQLHLTALYDEPRVLLMRDTHRLAGREFITLDDIADEPIPSTPDPVLNAFWRIDPRPDGRRVPEGPLIESIEDMLELVAAGEAVVIMPTATGLTSLRPHLTSVPLHGVEPCHVVLATRVDDHRPLVAAFRTYATTLLSVYG